MRRNEHRFTTTVAFPPPLAHPSGLVVIERGYNILDEIKEQGGRFRRESVGDLIDEKCWIVQTVDDTKAREIATHLKKTARASGFLAKVSCLWCNYFVFKRSIAPQVFLLCVSVVKRQQR